MAIQEKLKWSRLKSSLSFEDILSYFKSNSYTDILGHGFSSIEYSATTCSAIYNEKSKIVNISIDPFGNEFPQEFIEFSSIKFSIAKVTNKLFLISIINPPKSIRRFTDRICGDLDYKIGFASLDINIKDFLARLSNNADVSLLNIKKVKVGNVVISNEAKASIEITAKKDADNELKLLIKGKDYSLDKVKFSCFFLGETLDIEISKSGLLSAPHDQMGFFTLLLTEQVLSREI